MVGVHVHLMSRHKMLIHHVLHLWPTIRVVWDPLCVARLRLLDEWNPLHHITLMLVGDMPLHVVLLRCIYWGTTLELFSHVISLTPIHIWWASLWYSCWTLTLRVIETALGSLIMSTLGGRT
jgi:hypothetical protein